MEPFSFYQEKIWWTIKKKYGGGQSRKKYRGQSIKIQ